MATGYTPTKETTNFAKISWVVVDVCRNVLFDVVGREISPIDIPKEIKANPLSVKLYPEQKNRICNKPGGAAPNHSDFDISSLYTIIRNLCIGIQPPTRGWFDNTLQNHPTPSDVRVSDDVERLRSKRNMLVGHTKGAEMSDAVFAREISDIKQILTRLDRHLGTTYLNGVTSIERCCMDPKMEERYILEVEEQEKRDKETRQLLTQLEVKQKQEKTMHEQTREDVSAAKKALKEVKEDHTKTSKSLRELEEIQKQEKALHGQTRNDVSETVKSLKELKEDQTTTRKSLVELEEKQREVKILHEQTRVDGIETKKELTEIKEDQTKTRKSLIELEGIQKQEKALHKQTREDVTETIKALTELKEAKNKTSQSLMELEDSLKHEKTLHEQTREDVIETRTTLGELKEQFRSQKLTVGEKRGALLTPQLQLTQLEDSMATCDQSQQAGKNTLHGTKLQDHLRQSYIEDETSKVSILPSAHDIPLSQVFTTIVIREDLENTSKHDGETTANITHHQDTGEKSDSTNKEMDSYRDLFYKDEALRRNIYLLGQAGSGKTTFCKHLVDVWCKSPYKAHFRNVEEITNFEYVFFVSCRDAETSDTIMNMILDQLFDSETEYLYPTVRYVLNRNPEKCLILVDGLDEWAGSPSKSTGARSPCGLPNRKGLENCVVLTTSRPWRIEALRQGLGKHHRVLEIQGLNDSGMKTLSLNLLSALNVSHKLETIQLFMTNIKAAKITGIVQTPLMLIIVLTIWLADRKLDRSLCVNFIGMIESLIQRAEGQSGRTNDFNRLADISQLPKLKSEWAKQIRQLPHCFVNMDLCNQFAPLIYKLANFAFDAIFNEIKENSLVFSIEVIEKVFKKAELEVCLKIGILSLSSATMRSVKRMAKCSFLHKSLQEFLAALWMADMESKLFLTVFKTHCKSLTDVLDYSKILVFICGLSQDKGKKLWSCINEMINADPSVQEHRQAVVTSAYESVRSEHSATQSVLRLYQLAVDCLTEANHVKPDQTNGHLKHYMIPDIYVGDEMSVDHCDLAYGQVLASPCEVRSLIVDRTRMAPVLEHSLHKLVHLERLHIDLQSTPSLQQGIRLCSSISRLTSLWSLYMYNCWSEIDRHLSIGMHQSASMSSFRKDSPLSLKFSQLRKLTLIGRASITPRLHLSLPVTMATLHLSHVALSHQSIGSLISLLRSASTLRKLNIRWLECFDCGPACRYDVDLTAQSQLERLELRYLYPYRGVQSVRVSPDMTELQKIWMEYILMPTLSWKIFLLSLPRPAHGLTVWLRGCDVDSDSVRYITCHFTVTRNVTNSDGRRSIEFQSVLPV